MDEIELVIKIDEDIYKARQHWVANPKKMVDKVDIAIANGTPLSRGHWISGHDETGALGITYTEKICSNCGWSHSLVIPKNYCPECGAKMAESEVLNGREIKEK